MDIEMQRDPGGYTSNESWKVEAECQGLDTEIFFSEMSPTATALAKSICAQCTVQDACLEWAISDGQILGILGGTTARERLRALKHGRFSSGAPGSI